MRAGAPAADTAFELGLATGQPEAFFGYAGQIFQIHRAQDRLAEVAEAIRQILDENPALQVFRAGLAYVWCELGREPDARAPTDSIDVSHGGALQFWSTALMLWAEICHTLALPVDRRLRAPLFVARTRLAYAELLIGAEPGRARALATDARATACQFGFARINRRTEQLFQRLP